MTTQHEDRRTIPADLIEHARFAPAPASFPIIALAPPIEWMRFCYACNSDQMFVADRACVSGLVGKCSNCGDERIAPFTRVNSEVA